MTVGIVYTNICWEKALKVKKLPKLGWLVRKVARLVTMTSLGIE